MSNQILAATRKGLFTLERQAAQRWSIAKAEFVGDNVTNALIDPRDGEAVVLPGLFHSVIGHPVRREFVEPDLQQPALVGGAVNGAEALGHEVREVLDAFRHRDELPVDRDQR